MNIIESLNWMGIIGTSLLMMAVSTIWYSNVLFGTMWTQSQKRSLESQDQPRSVMIRSLLYTFVCFIILLSGLAYAQTVLVPLLKTAPLVVAVGIVIFVGAFTAVPVIWEQKSFVYYLINLGFELVFILGGTLILHYWPW